MFRQIHKIARKKPGLLFWEKMAEEETHTKGKRSRTLELIIPDGFQDALEEGQEEDGYVASHENTEEYVPVSNRLERGPSTPANERTSTGAIDLEGDEVMQSSSSSAHDRPTTSSRPSGTSEVGNLALAIRNQVPVSFPGENSSFLSYVTRGELGQPSDTNQASGSSDRITAFPLFTPRHRGSLGSTGASGTIRTKTEDDSQPEPDNERTGIFDLTLRDALEYIFLQKDEAADILAVFNDSVLVQNRPESEQIKSFITSGEFVPRIVQVNDPTRNTNAADGNEPSGDSADLQVGDRHGFGRRYQLQGINNSDDLGKHIISLGHLYRQARRFNLVALINMITLKLQVAWNSYPGLSQLEPLLEVVSMAFQNNSDDNKDQLQAWLISFMADTLDLIYFACSGRFWEVMQGNSALQRAVFAARSDIVAKNPEKYSDARVLIRSRGIDRV